jgi:hypothetical protein
MRRTVKDIFNRPTHYDSQYIALSFFLDNIQKKAECIRQIKHTSATQWDIVALNTVKEIHTVSIVSNTGNHGILTTRRTIFINLASATTPSAPSAASHDVAQFLAGEFLSFNVHKS